MAESERTRERPADDSPFDESVGSDLDFGEGQQRGRDADDAASQSRVGRARSRLRSPFSGLFSIRSFLVTLVLTVVAGVVVGGFLPIPGAGLLGIAGVGFGLGVLSERRRYLELLLSGAAAAGVGTFFSFLLVSLLGPGLALTAVGATAGAVAGAVGHYFGRDLRDGLTREL